jgi:hypothetical protein
MRLRLRAAMAASIAFLLAACDKGPREVYYEMATAAEFGDAEGFLAGFTEESKQLVASQISLTEAYGLKKENPVALLVFPSVDGVEEKDDEAILTVSRGTVERRIVMVKTDAGWKIDVKRLADFWEDERKNR